MKKELQRIIELPEGMTATVDGRLMTIKGNGKEFSREFEMGRVEVTVDGNQIGCYWRHDGSLDTLDNGIEDTSNVSSQIAGHRILGTADSEVVWAKQRRKGGHR